MKVGSDWSPKRVTHLVKRIVNSKVSFCQERHDVSHKAKDKENIPVSDSAKYRKNNDDMRWDFNHVVKRFENLSIENLEVSIEYAENLSDRGYVKEKIYWSKKDSSQGLSVDMSTDASLFLVKNIVTKDSQGKPGIADSEQILHVA